MAIQLFRQPFAGKNAIASFGRQLRTRNQGSVFAEFVIVSRFNANTNKRSLTAAVRGQPGELAPARRPHHTRISLRNPDDLVCLTLRDHVALGVHHVSITVSPTIDLQMPMATMDSIFSEFPEYVENYS